MSEATTVSAEMEGKVCLVTGATSGLGRHTAQALAQRGATVVLGGRDQARGERARDEIRAATGNPEVHLLLGDLSSQAEVRRFADELRGRFSSLDVLVNNAGGYNAERLVTADGLERTFATNHLGPFLLTVLLLDLLKASAPARVVSVASLAHRFAGLDFEDLQSERRYDGMRVYGQSKLANILFTRELARRLEGSGVTANCLHPGVVASGFGWQEPGFFGWLFRVGRPLLITPEKGARTAVYLATAPEVAGVSGRYFARCREVRPSREARDPEVARRLWEVSERLTGIEVRG